jgi:hypothetical protein
VKVVREGADGLEQPRADNCRRAHSRFARESTVIPTPEALADMSSSEPDGEWRWRYGFRSSWDRQSSLLRFR